MDAAATTARAAARMKARHDPAIAMTNVVFEAGPDNTLKGMRIAYPADAMHTASVDDLRFELMSGAGDSEFATR